MDRRQLIIGVLAGSTAAAASRLGADRVAAEGTRGSGEAGGRGAPVPIADMHAHLFFIGPNPASRRPLAPAMAAGGATLVSWSLVGDLPWLGQSPRGLRQKATPSKGAATKWFEAELARAKAHIDEQGLRLAVTPAEVDAAAGGKPHVVLSVEGASFLDDGIEGLERAHAAGVRHLQLVHYIRNAIGDFQTEAPQHNGLTALGREVVRRCNRLGILIDLAHCTEDVVAQVLDLSAAPVVWSHGSVAPAGTQPSYRQVAWQARRLPLATAKAITAKGGVIGLWALGSDVGRSIETYTDRLIEMAGWLGHEHVAFGSDIGALSNAPVASFADLRRVVGVLEQRGFGDEKLRAIAFHNYARVLKQAMDGAQG